MPRSRFTTAHAIALVLVIAATGIRLARESTPEAFANFTPAVLPEDDAYLVRFLLMMPFAALVVCFVRNVIGLATFGTFTPALLALTFRDVHSYVGAGVLFSVLLLGWVCRRGVQKLYLLQVPRTAFMLSIVVVVLVGFIFAVHRIGRTAASAIPLLPLVIVTGMIERFWSMEEEEGTAVSFRTLAHTLLVAIAILFLIRIPTLYDTLVNYPETIGWVMAGQLVIGRYTGYRLTELYRFRNIT